MSVEIANSTAALAAETLVEVAWAQWSGLTAAATGADQPRVWTIIDPEALVLVSLAVRDRERRLNDLLAALARTGSSLLSTQRLKSLAQDYPEAVREQIPEFAHWATEAGDRRWRSFAADHEAKTREHPREKDLGPLRLTEGPGLMLRLRAGIGVSAKADLLTFLLGMNGAAADLKTIALATAYSNRALRTAAGEMALARFIHEIAGPPTAYRADPKAWGEVLQTHPPNPRSPTSKGAPSWRFWSVVFSFLTAVIHWELQSRQEEWSTYVASSRARDLMDDYRRRLRLIDAEMGSARDTRGTAYLDSFNAEVEQVRDWALRSLRD
jgi:hypothetical protein